MFERARDLFAGLAPARYTSLCVADLDGCGSRALLLGAVAAPNAVFALTASGPVPCDADRLAEPTAATVAICAADVDGDGAEELLIGNSEVASGPKAASERLFDLDEGRFVDLLAGIPDDARNRFALGGAVAVPAVGRAAGVLLLPVGGPFRLFAAPANGDGLIECAAAVGLDDIAPGGCARLLPWADGRELLLLGAGAARWVYERMADGRFVERVAGWFDTGEPLSAMVPVASTPGGRLDLLCTSAGAVQRLYAPAAVGSPVDVSPGLLAQAGPVVDAVAADFDGDGEDELFLLCAGEPNRLFGWREGGWRPLDAGAATRPLGADALAATADLDGDGRPELVLLPGAGREGIPEVFRAARADGLDVLTVDVRGLSGAPARGAAVVATIGGRRRVRLLDCGNGRVQGEPVVRFALARGAIAETLEVRWPDGASLTRHRLAAGERVRIEHPAAGLRRAPARSSA